MEGMPAMKKALVSAETLTVKAKWMYHVTAATAVAYTETSRREPGRCMDDRRYNR
jgi:hypothetical protein